MYMVDNILRSRTFIIRFIINFLASKSYLYFNNPRIDFNFPTQSTIFMNSILEILTYYNFKLQIDRYVNNE